MGRQVWILLRMGAQFLVLSAIIFSLLSYWPGSKLPAAVADAGVGVQTVTLGELTRRVERVEGIGLEHRLAQLEARVEANSTLLWTGLFGLGALVLEMFGRMGVSLVHRARHHGG